MLLRSVGLAGALLLIGNQLRAQEPGYAARSPYLQQPNLAIGFVDSSAAFWVRAYDDDRGGFYSDVHRDGTPHGSRKHALIQGRNAFGLVRAFMVTGNEAYLDLADGALRFMYDHAWDEVNGGWVNELSLNGTQLDPTADKQAVFQHFALLGIAAYAEATRDPEHLAWAEKAYAAVDRLWDESRGGYYERTSSAWSNPRRKTASSNADALKAHQFSLYLLTGDAAYRTRLHDLGDVLVDRIVGRMDDPSTALGFPMSYGADWSVDTGDTQLWMGHVFKIAGILARYHQLFGDDPDGNRYLEAAQRVFGEACAAACDTVHGGVFHDYSRTTGARRSLNKEWWHMNEAIISALHLYGADPQDAYLEMLDEALLFYMHHFVDRPAGEVFNVVTMTGSPTQPDNKGNQWKGAYHSVEQAYDMYLYGNLFVAGQPATLHYKIDAGGEARTVRVAPLLADSARLKLSGVTLDGAAYTDFDADRHTLTLPAGVGGTFAVTYQFDRRSTSAEDDAEIPARLAIERAFPNPARDRLTLSVRLPTGGLYDVAAYDLLGRRVYARPFAAPSPGSHEIPLALEDASSGLYLVVVRSADGALQARRRVQLVRW